MTKHIPEPWEVGPGKPPRPYLIARIYDTIEITGGAPTGGGPYPPATVGQDNAERIVACVNALAGLELPLTAEVGSVAGIVDWAFAYFKEEGVVSVAELLYKIDPERLLKLYPEYHEEQKRMQDHRVLQKRARILLPAGDRWREREEGLIVNYWPGDTGPLEGKYNVQIAFSGDRVFYFSQGEWERVE